MQKKVKSFKKDWYSKIVPYDVIYLRTYSVWDTWKSEVRIFVTSRDKKQSLMQFYHITDNLLRSLSAGGDNACHYVLDKYGAQCRLIVITASYPSYVLQSSLFQVVTW